MYDSLPFLKKILALPGLSGYESPVRQVIADEWGPFVDELQTVGWEPLWNPPRHSLRTSTKDSAGSSYGCHWFDGHPGAERFYRFTRIGGVDPRILPGQKVIVHGRRDLPGVIGQPSPRLLPEFIGKKTVPMEYLLIDVGLSTEETRALVRTGDPISFAQPPIELTDNTLAGHTLDNRASVAALSVCLHELSTIRHTWDVWAVATVQEEETLAGAITHPTMSDLILPWPSM
jgi:endoglucanase